jgi:hypothetical protein
MNYGIGGGTNTTPDFLSPLRDKHVPLLIHSSVLGDFDNVAVGPHGLDALDPEHVRIVLVDGDDFAGPAVCKLDKVAKIETISRCDSWIDGHSHSLRFEVAKLRRAVVIRAARRGAIGSTFHIRLQAKIFQALRVLTAFCWCKQIPANK